MHEPMAGHSERKRKAAGPATSELYMNEHAAAAALLVSVRTLQRWRVDGRGPRYVKLCGKVYYTRKALDACVAAAERQSTSEPAA